jgi:hypothetical protein
MAVRHGEAAAGTEVVLDVNNEKRIALADGQFFFQAEILSFSANRRSTSLASLTKASATSTGWVLSRNGPGTLFSSPENGDDLLNFPAIVGTLRAAPVMYGRPGGPLDASIQGHRPETDFSSALCRHVRTGA